MHSDSHIRLDSSFPHLWENYLAAWAYQIVVSLFDMLPNDFYMKEGLLDEVLNTLCTSCELNEISELENWVTYLPCAGNLERERKFASYSVCEL